MEHSVWQEKSSGERTKIFVNLAVKDLARSKTFFEKLGFSFNPAFTDHNAACLVISEEIYAMLLAEGFFRGFIPGKEICDSAKSAEALIAITVKSRQEVDQLVEKAIAAGGSEYRQAQDHGWMYGRAIQDPDGHIWEIFYADMDAMPDEMKKRTPK